MNSPITIYCGPPTVHGDKRGMGVVLLGGRHVVSPNSDPLVVKKKTRDAAKKKTQVIIFFFINKIK